MGDGAETSFNQLLMTFMILELCPIIIHKMFLERI